MQAEEKFYRMYPGVFLEQRRFKQRQRISKLWRFPIFLLLVSSIIVAESGRDLRALPRTLEPSSSTAAEIDGHIAKLTSQRTNRRVPCTSGNSKARSYIASALARGGVEPAAASFAHADTWWDSYFDVVAGSVDPELCPDGIANVVGLVRGTVFPDEVVVFVAHYDGARDAQHGQDLYDNAAAVAVGLKLASDLAASPPKRTVVFIFGDGEQGWANVGELKTFSCSGRDSAVATDIPEMVKRTARGCTLNGGNYPIGMVDWLDRAGSFINPIHVKLAIVADSLGMPMVDSKPDPIVAIGTEGTPGLRELLDSAWDSLGPQIVSLPLRPVIERGSGALDFCSGIGSAGCLISRGVPSVWFTQPGSEMVKRAVRQNPRLKATAVPRPDAERLSQVLTALLGTIRSLADSPSLRDFSLRSEKDIFDPLAHQYTMQDAEELSRGFERLTEVALAAGDHTTIETAVTFGGKLRIEVLRRPADEFSKEQELLLQLAGRSLAELWVGIKP